MDSKLKTEPPDKKKNVLAKTGLGKEKELEKKNRIVIDIPKRLLWLSAVVGIAALICGGYISKLKREALDLDATEGVINGIGIDGFRLFQQFDQDRDGYISVEEFEPLFQTLTGGVSNVQGGFDINQPIHDTDHVVTVHAYLDPLQLDSMTKDINKMMISSLDPLAGLKKWLKPTADWMNFAVYHFSGFFPTDPDSTIAVGQVYDIIQSELVGYLGPLQLSSHRYFPPKVDATVMGIHRLLSLFHPRPFLLTRFGPQGSAACVRAYNNDYVDIVFRIHAEFQLHEPPHYPFWFCPAQFTGNVIVSRDYEQILHFQMFVPNDKKLNVDMEWLYGPKENDHMEVDIGYLPWMELNITAPSFVLTEKLKHFKEIQIPLDNNMHHMVKNIKWTESISMEDAKNKLEVKFYPFLKVPYHNLTTAFSLAQEEEKLVHSILLWGALDDQSC